MPGSFIYSPASGSVLGAGLAQALHVDFTPDDAVNYAVASKDAIINVLKRTTTLTWNNPSDITYGTALGATQLNATASVPGNFVYCPTSGTVVSAGNGQTLNVNFTPADAGNYTNAFKVVTINVLQANQAVILSNMTQTYDGNPKSVTVTTSPIANLICVVVYNVIRSGGSGGPRGGPPPTDAGSYSVVALITDPNFNGIACGTLIILKANQTITFGALADKNLWNADFSVNATATSALPVTFNATGSCTISGNVAHIRSTGNCTITAHQAGNVNYNPATDVSQTFTVT